VALVGEPRFVPDSVAAGREGEDVDVAVVADGSSPTCSSSPGRLPVRRARPVRSNQFSSLLAPPVVGGAAVEEDATTFDPRLRSPLRTG